MSWTCKEIESDYHQDRILATGDVIKLLALRDWREFKIRWGDMPKYVAVRDGRVLLARNGYVNPTAKDVHRRVSEGGIADDVVIAWYDAAGRLIKHVRANGAETFYNGFLTNEVDQTPSLACFAWELATTLKAQEDVYLLDSNNVIYDTLSSTAIGVFIYLGAIHIPVHLLGKSTARQILSIAQHQIYLTGRDRNIRDSLPATSSFGQWDHGHRIAVEALGG